jgi:hypothetical protein
MIVAFLLSAGIGWEKLDAFEMQLTAVQTSMTKEPANAERLARVEEKLDRLIRDVDRLQDKVNP